MLELLEEYWWLILGSVAAVAFSIVRLRMGYRPSRAQMWVLGVAVLLAGYYLIKLYFIDPVFYERARGSLAVRS
jgi:hypothetical protein